MREPIPKGQWVHLTWVMDEKDSSVYVNGKRSIRVDTEGRNIGFHNAYIGFANNGSAWSFFKGEMDELLVWSRALSGVQIGEVFSLYKD
ncbi:MAG: LamG-like jellyroll fold domain-containing protein [Verrucomicrobiota bacterium]